MKKAILALAVCSFIGLNAQETPKEVTEETRTKIIKVKVNGEVKERKIEMIKTRETTPVKLDPRDAGKDKQDRVMAPTKVDKTVMVKDDDDYGFDNYANYTYTRFDGETYAMNPNASGFTIVTDDGDVLLANARLSTENNMYLVTTEDYSGIGFFRGNKFIVEYYDDENDMLVMEEYNRNNMKRTKTMMKKK